ncbi:MAG TPA: molybdopterin oxidoreductase [Acetobacterium sp.]|nr:molybdopterin oxidoreductase [Acetobacterium sp.]
MKKEMTCIVCPIGCQMTIEEKADGTYEVTGNTCKRGPKYAINEMTNPTRVIPTTVVIKNAMLPRLPVKTAEPIPKGQIFDAMAAINQVVVEAPVKTGDVVIKDLLGLGNDVVATRTMDKC